MRTLTMAEVCRRVQTLDALYLNADRWLRRAQETTDDAERAAAHDAWMEADREYRRVCQLAYRIADGAGNWPN